MGDFGAYSFFPSKNLGGFGDGGLLVSNNDERAEAARMMRNHGSKPKYYHSVIGGNFRMDTVQAALLQVKLLHYDSYTAGRRNNADYYTRALQQLPGVVQADPAHCKCVETQRQWLDENDAAIVLPVSYEHNFPIWNQYTIRVLGAGKRDALKGHLLAHGIGCEVYYPLTMDQQECFAYTDDFCRSDCEVAHQLANEVLSIPIYAELMESQRQEAVDAIAVFLS
jgi:dTDP-4-amino-4,6-dideoxygalactose transaminase